MFRPNSATASSMPPATSVYGDGSQAYDFVYVGDCAAANVCAMKADTVDEFIEAVCRSLVHGKHIEIRGFGSFSLHYRAPRIGRNPKTGEKIIAAIKWVDGTVIDAVKKVVE